MHVRRAWGGADTGRGAEAILNVVCEPARGLVSVVQGVCAGKES